MTGGIESESTDPKWKQVTEKHEHEWMTRMSTTDVDRFAQAVADTVHDPSASFLDALAEHPAPQPPTREQIAEAWRRAVEETAFSTTPELTAKVRDYFERGFERGHEAALLQKGGER